MRPPVVHAQTRLRSHPCRRRYAAGRAQVQAARRGSRSGGFERAAVAAFEEGGVGSRGLRVVREAHAEGVAVGLDLRDARGRRGIRFEDLRIHEVGCGLAAVESGLRVRLRDEKLRHDQTVEVRLTTGEGHGGGNRRVGDRVAERIRICIACVCERKNGG